MLCGVALALLALLVGLRLARPGALPTVMVGDVAVGGLDGELLRGTVAGAGAGETVVVVTLGDGRVEATGAEIGYELDVEATAEAALRRGRQLNPIAALLDHLRSFTGTPIVVELVERVDEDRLAAWAADATATLDAEVVEGSVVFAGTDVERIDPEPGFEVRTDELAAAARAALLDDGPREFEAPAEETTPETTVADVDRLLVDAERAVSGTVTLTRGEASLVLEPPELASILRVERNGTLSLVADATRLDLFVGADLREALETEPRDARFEIDDDTVELVPSRTGFRFDAEVAAEQIARVATSAGSRETVLLGETVEPALSTADAEALGITEPVSTFTTHFTAGQSRVTNIHLIADLVDGALIEPGERFSVNGHVGERTREKGFVAGGAIQNGEFVSEVGGGVSQFATTMYNAAYFGGYEISDYKAHSYYISRYPVGREATLNYPDVDLEVHNNSPHGILVEASHTSTSVTVTFWSTAWVEVESVAGNRRNIREAPTQVRENPDLPEGTERVVQSGRAGFDITVTRILRFPDGTEEREEVVTRYLPEPRIVERGTEPVDEEDAEDAEADGDGDAEGGGDGDSGSS